MTVRTLTQSNVPTAERLAAILQQLSRIVVGKSEPLKLSLKEHDIKPRDLAGKFLAGALEKVGQKIDDTVQISLDLKASR